MSDHIYVGRGKIVDVSKQEVRECPFCPSAFIDVENANPEDRLRGHLESKCQAANRYRRDETDLRSIDFIDAILEGDIDPHSRDSDGKFL